MSDKKKVLELILSTSLIYIFFNNNTRKTTKKLKVTVGYKNIFTKKNQNTLGRHQQIKNIKIITGFQ